MAGPTETTDAQHAFATDVLRGVLDRITRANAERDAALLVSHACVAGATMCVVYRSLPSGTVRGLARDTRQCPRAARPPPH